VQEITRLLAEAACVSREGPITSFGLEDEGWEVIQVASLLHDCGKVTTPEHVVDKVTKLETITDRIHEGRMRFELLKAEAASDHWRAIAA
jgi:response regulator RpfG family c-di-GMP phosphodiesterase